MDPKTLKELLESLAELSVEALKEKHAEVVAAFAAVVPEKDDEGNEKPLTIAQMRDRKAFAEAAETIKSVYVDATALASDDLSIGDLPEPEAPKAEEGGEAPKAEEGGEAPKAEDGTDLGKAGADAADASGDNGEPGGNAGAPADQVPPTNLDEEVQEMAPVMAAAFNGSRFEKGEALSMEDMAMSFLDATNVHNADTVIATIAPRLPEGAPVLGGDPVENYKLLYPGAERFDVTAAVCGPVQPIPVIPECFQGGEPMADTFTTVATSFGQVQIYDPQGLGDVEGVTLDAATCDDCDAAPAAVDCLTADCILPGDPVQPVPYLACMCVDESLAFSNPIVLRHHMRRLTTFWEQQKELRRMERVREQSYVRTFGAPYGSAAAITQAIGQAKAVIQADPRFTGRFEDYQAFIPGGESLFANAMADIGNRFTGCCDLGADIQQKLTDMGISDIIFGLDHEENSSSAGFEIQQGLTGALGNGGAAPLEPFTQFATIYLYRKQDFLVATPFQTQIGLDTREKDEMPNGCMKMYRREWWIEPLKFGCNPSMVLDMSGLCASGSGPDAQTPVCAGSEAGGGGQPLP